jgi:hypothetical protein
VRLSEERISHLAHLVLDALRGEGLIEIPDSGEALRVTKEAFARVLSVDDQVDDLVRHKLSRQRKVPGSREWQILYEKYFREEMEKRKW